MGQGARRAPHCHKETAFLHFCGLFFSLVNPVPLGGKLKDWQGLEPALRTRLEMHTGDRLQPQPTPKVGPLLSGGPGVSTWLDPGRVQKLLNSPQDLVLQASF